MIVSDLIRSALRMSAGMNPGETATSDESTDALFVLNAMLDAWNTERLNIYTISAATYTLVPGQMAYSIGAAGNFNGARPIMIESANLIITSLNPAVRRPLELLNDQQWADIRVQAVSTSIPLKMYNDGAYPLSTLSFWPTPNAAHQVELYIWQALAAFATVADTVTLPPGYADAIRYNLGVRIAAEWGRALRPDVLQLAIKSKANIQSLNTPAPLMVCDAAVLGRGGAAFNWLIGE